MLHFNPLPHVLVSKTKMMRVLHLLVAECFVCRAAMLDGFAWHGVSACTTTMVGRICAVAVDGICFKVPIASA
jgi:hypothetical protein